MKERASGGGIGKILGYQQKRINMCTFKRCFTCNMEKIMKKISVQLFHFLNMAKDIVQLKIILEIKTYMFRKEL